MNSTVAAENVDPTSTSHRREVGWLGLTAIATGGANSVLFFLAAMFVGDGAIRGQGTAAVLVLGLGVILSCAAAPGWLELVLMYPNRVGGIAAACSEAFRPYSPILSSLVGIGYWFGWAPVVGLGAVLSGGLLHDLLLPLVSATTLALGIILICTVVSLCGLRWLVCLCVVSAGVATVLAMLSAVGPLSGAVEWHRTVDFRLTVPFPGPFGAFVSTLAGLYLVGTVAPAFEVALGLVGVTKAPITNVSRALWAGACFGVLYCLVLPIIWVDTLGPAALKEDLSIALGPTFAPLLGGVAKTAATLFMLFIGLVATIVPFAGPTRILSQLADDGLLPAVFAKRARGGAPWVAIILTSATGCVIVVGGYPIWLIAAVSLPYVLCIALTSVAVWLLRRTAPDMTRPYRAPRVAINLGIVAAFGWGLAVVFGLQQFGLPSVMLGISFA
ncbi:APC family permease [Paraburkholderia phytofirmans]|nr:amino acid permease [Paraburkholderia phytofirmans]